MDVNNRTFGFKQCELGLPDMIIIGYKLSLK